MPLKSFLGFGFGPIQSGLMLYEATRSGNFGSYVIAEIDQSLVDAVRENGNAVWVNVATFEGVLHEELRGFCILNPRVSEDRSRIAVAIRDADELATAIPSVDFYGAGGDASVAALLAGNVDGRRDQVLYASENNNYAAETLMGAVSAHSHPERLARLQVLNTVIGKMSGVISDVDAIEQLGLKPMVPGMTRAILVEEFNRIQVSRVRLPGFERGITVFEEKDDLLPFEEAKLFGHNAVHCLLGYMGALKGFRAMSELSSDRDLMALGRRAFTEECGPALIAKHGGTGDPLFTPTGFANYGDDLLRRMTNPYLNDKVARVCRDPARKLGWTDRIFGTMQECLAQGVEPTSIACAGVAGLAYLLDERDVAGRLRIPHDLTAAGIRTMLAVIWEVEELSDVQASCVASVCGAVDRVREAVEKAPHE